jgi:hypothetical protein
MCIIVFESYTFNKTDHEMKEPVKDYVKHKTYTYYYIVIGSYILTSSFLFYKSLKLCKSKMELFKQITLLDTITALMIASYGCYIVLHL